MASGPKFLQLSESEWPKKCAKRPYHKQKMFVAVLTQTQPKEQDPIRVQKTKSMSRGPPAVAAVQELVNERRFSNLRWLVRQIAWTWTAAKKYLCVKISEKEEWEAVPSSGVITENKREDVF